MDKILDIFIKPGKLAPGQSSAELIKQSIPKTGYAEWFQELLDLHIEALINDGLIVDTGNCYKLTTIGKYKVRDLVM